MIKIAGEKNRQKLKEDKTERRRKRKRMGKIEGNKR